MALSGIGIAGTVAAGVFRVRKRLAHETVATMMHIGKKGAHEVA